MAKILDARQRGLLRVVNKAATETKKILPPHLARAFRHSTKMEEDDRLFLEASFYHLIELDLQLQRFAQTLCCNSYVCITVHGYFY